MKVCVFGAGAIGGHIAARLCAANQADVSVVARGANLEAIRRDGLLLKSGGEEIRGKPLAATDDPATLPKQDIVIATLKAHAVPALASTIEQLLAPQGVAIFPLNGLTWWWRYGRPGAQEALPLLDPQRELWTRLRERTLGCVIYSPNEVASPGVIVHIGGNRWVMGEPNDQKTPRVQAAVDLFNKSGLPAEVSSDIRAEVWRKLMGNTWSNPMAALTHLAQFELTSDPDLKQLAARVMRETLEVAAAMGWDLRTEVDVDKHLSRATPGPGSPPSMLQDVLLGRSLEVEAHLGQTQAFAREHGVATPTIDVILPLLRGLDRSIRAAA
jgi:2-dehydropantoate 2-reductase